MAINKCGQCLARGRGRCQARLSHIGRTRKLVARPAWLPLLWGEGERDRRTVAAAQKVFGPRETEPQFLAALIPAVRDRVAQEVWRRWLHPLGPAVLIMALQPRLLSTISGVSGPPTP